MTSWACSKGVVNSRWAVEGNADCRHPGFLQGGTQCRGEAPSSGLHGHAHAMTVEVLYEIENIVSKVGFSSDEGDFSCAESCQLVPDCEEFLGTEFFFSCGRARAGATVGAGVVALQCCLPDRVDGGVAALVLGGDFSNSLLHRH